MLKDDTDPLSYEQFVRRVRTSMQKKKAKDSSSEMHEVGIGAFDLAFMYRTLLSSSLIRAEDNGLTEPTKTVDVDLFVDKVKDLLCVRLPYGKTTALACTLDDMMADSLTVLRGVWGVFYEPVQNVIQVGDRHHRHKHTSLPLQ
jgi:hypothetical protein